MPITPDNPPLLCAEAAPHRITVFRAGEHDAPLAVQHAAPDRRPHIHPLLAPDGRGVLTEDTPAHHPWQHGLYVGLNDVNGYGFWKERDEDGTFHPEPLTPPRVDGNCARWTVRCEWHAPHSGVPVLRETQEWTLTDAAERGMYRLDMVWSLQAARGDVAFGRYPYGGLFLRMPYRAERGGVVRNNEGKENADTEQQRARWVAVAIPIEGRDGPAGIALLDSPDNPEHPTPWRVDSQFGVAPSRCIAGPWHLAAGETTRSYYRLVAFAGPIVSEQIESEWRAFAAEKGAQG